MNKFLLILFTVIALVGGLNAEEWTQSKTWFGDPDLQGTWTNASLTNLERPDYYETLIVSDEEARATLRMSEASLFLLPIRPVFCRRWPHTS